MYQWDTGVKIFGSDAQIYRAGQRLTHWQPV